MTSANDFTKLVPGFDFLQSLMKTGGTTLPSIGQWIAPTLEPEELQRRIDELRTVQFWLEQNSKLLGTTIQALEVQRMTLATLKGMNLPLADLTESLKIGKPKAAVGASVGAPPASPAIGAKATSSSRGNETPKQAPKPAPNQAGAGKVSAAPIDPMQWWGALTQQFTELASKALEDGSAKVARNLAGAAVKQGVAAAGDSIERAMAMSGAMSGKAAGLAAKAGSVVAGGALKTAGAGAAVVRAARGARAERAVRPAASGKRRKT